MSEREWRIDLPWDRPPLSLNDRMHWQPKARLTRTARSIADILAQAQRLPKGLAHIHVELHWTPARAGRKDSLNFMATLKPLIDGLVDYGLVVDDDSTRVTEQVVIHPAAKPAALWLVVREVAA